MSPVDGQFAFDGEPLSASGSRSRSRTVAAAVHRASSHPTKARAATTATSASGKTKRPRNDARGRVSAAARHSSSPLRCSDRADISSVRPFATLGCYCALSRASTRRAFSISSGVGFLPVNCSNIAKMPSIEMPFPGIRTRFGFC